MKKENDNKTIDTGLSLCEVLTVIFIILKLTNVISWPWLWVVSPIWIPWGIAIFAVSIWVWEREHERKRKEKLIVTINGKNKE